MMRSSDQEDQQSRLIYELCALLFTILRTSSSSSTSPSSRARARAPQQVTPAAFASLLLGASMALMLCGSVTFVLGFLLMPWVVGLVVILYVLGVVSYISSRLERTVFWCSGGAASSSSNEMQGQFFSKLPID